MRIACIGECMIELSQLDLAARAARAGFAGDTANTAIYLARLGQQVSYVTNLGQDGLSDQIIAGLAAEGIDCSLIGRHPTRLPGLYAIETDPFGERSFRYWRDGSAARTLFDGVGATWGDLDAFDVIYLSGITLAILPEAARAALTRKLGALRTTGTQIVFDSNYRPRLWQDAPTARAACDALWAVTSIGLPSLDDEIMLAGHTTAAEVLTRIVALGVPEVVLKRGAAGPVLWRDGPVSLPDMPAPTHVVDTSGAGDSFNAGYLAARLSGADPVAAAQAGHAIALRVIAVHGAVIPVQAMPGPILTDASAG